MLKLFSNNLMLISLLSYFIFACGELREQKISEKTSCAADSCHLATNLRKYPPETGKHLVHLKAGFLCNDCHNNYLSDANHKNSINDQDNASKIVFFNEKNPAGAWANDKSECSNIACHKSVQESLNWYQESSKTCLICHASGSPVDPLVTNGSGVSGKHQVHVTGQKLECPLCHYDYKLEGSHRNGVYGKAEPENIVFFGGEILSHKVSGVFNKANKKCLNISCHGYTDNSDWYNVSFSSSCTSCHYNGSSIDPLTSGGSGVKGKHTVHVSKRGIECEVCHQDYKAKPSHVNGIYGKNETNTIVNFSGIFPDPGGNPVNVSGFDKSSGNCAVISCHINNSASWYSLAVSQCTDCHSGGGVYDPLASNGTGDQGKHLAHVTNKKIDCEICHKDYKNQITHINGIYGKAEADSILNFSGVYPALGGISVSVGTFDNINCTNISCHGNTDASWYASTTSCSLCHKDGSSIDPKITNGSGTNGKHLEHVTNLGYSCDTCHKDYNGKSTHLNGTYGKTESDIIVYFNAANPAAFWMDNDKSCNNMTCHGKASWYATTETCTSCHSSGKTTGAVDPLITNGIGDSGKHLVHVRDKGLYCGKCHFSYKDTVNHRNSILDTVNPFVSIVLFDASNGSGLWINDSGANQGACDLLNCHSTGSMDWYVSNPWTKPACSACHNSTMGTRRQVFKNGSGTGDFNKKSHHVINYGTTDEIVTDSDCEVCHNMDNHMSGDIRLKDYDNLTNIITYDPANPATLEPFCLGCHDTDGANGNMKPFSSPNVLGESTGRNQAGSKIESSWEKANGHRRQGLTCMGTGAAGTGCHGDSGAGTINAHGSDNNGLLVKKLTLPIGTSDWNESNFTLCLDCHANTLDKNIMSMKDLVIVANGGNYAQYGSDIFPYTGTNEFMVSGFHDYKAYNYDRQFNLHLYHLRNSTWRYRGIDPSYESCITCHNVHGVDGQDFYLWDEWHFFKEIDNGIEYGRFGFLPSMNGPLRYPNYCTNACHGVTWDEQYRYPRTNFNEAYAVASKSSGALGTNDTVTIQFSHSTNELSLVSGTSDTGPPFGIDKALPAGGGAKKWGTINAVWSNSAKTLTITISSPSAASPVSVNDLIQLAPYQGGMGLNEFTIYNWSILDLQGVPYRGKVTLKGN